MKTLLLTVLLLGLVAALRAQDVLSDDQDDFSGTWYPKAVVDNCSMLHRWPKKVFPVTVTALEGGDLEAKVILWKKGQCHEFKILMKKSNKPGKYTVNKGKKTVYIRELPVKDHYVFYWEHRVRRKSFREGRTHGRDSEDSPEAMEEFKKSVKKKGFREEYIFIPELQDHCDPESD